MSDDKALNLVRLLYKRTTAGSIDWQYARKDEVSASVDEYSLVLRRQEDQDYPEQPDYFLTLVDSQGRNIETISNISLRPLMDRVGDEGLNPYQLLAETYRLARRKALGVDEALDSVLKRLAEG